MSDTSLNPIQPVDRAGLIRLSEKGKADPAAVRTLKVKTVLESKFRHLNYIRNLPPHIIDEPPGLLGDDTAQTPRRRSWQHSGPAFQWAYMPTLFIAIFV
jgi:hypothetical protein